MRHGNGIRRTLKAYLIFHPVYPVSQGVESQRCASFQAALDAGQTTRIGVDQSSTLTDGKLKKEKKV